MPINYRRRTLLQSSFAAFALTLFNLPAHAREASALRFGPPQPFSFEVLKQRARALAASAYAPPPKPSPEITSKIDYATHGQIRFNADNALWAEGPGMFPVTFFHLGQFFQKSVKMHAVRDGQASEVLYSEALFNMPADSIARGLPSSAGFAGFRFQENRKGFFEPAPDRSVPEIAAGFAVPRIVETHAGAAVLILLDLGALRADGLAVDLVPALRGGAFAFADGAVDVLGVR